MSNETTEPAQPLSTDEAPIVPPSEPEPNPANQTRTRHVVEYDYPGALFPESVSREVDKPTLDAVLAAAPDEEGYFKRDRWYAATIRAIEEKRFEAADGEVTWVRLSSDKVDSWVVGERIPLTDPRIDNDASGALRSNLAQYERIGGPGGKTTDGVLCRTGNWQPAAEYSHVITDDEAKRA